MAYVNIAEWTPEHVGEWLRGLDDAILPYVHFFLNNNIDGRHLLTLAPDDLTHLHITKVGHQELILEAINLLRLLHYNLTSENLQCLALKLGCKARSLYNELKRNGPLENTGNGKQERLSTATLSSVSDILLCVKSFISWLDRNPFEGKDQYAPVRKTILKLSIELASTAQRDQFVEKPHAVIKNSCLNLANLCDTIVQEFSDSLIIQPASLDVATVKKKPDEELGMHLHSSYSGVHIVGGVKFQSPAHRCAKIEIGDEIVQVNYQTVVGWQLKKLVYAMREHSTDVYLTLKKRPRHTNILGQVIILRPYRIPSKKSAFGKVHKWSEGNSSLHIQEYPPSNQEQTSPQGEADDDDDMAFLPDYITPSSNEISVAHYQILPAKTRATVQRRATVSGASPTVKRPPVSIEDLVSGTKFWKKEAIGRSISHDPSKHTITSENSFAIKKLDTIKSDGSEDNCDRIGLTSADEKQILNDDNVNSDLRDVENSVKRSPTHSVSTCNDNSLKASSIVIPLPEEEYTILENKSLGKIGKNIEKVPVKEESSDKDAESQKSDRNPQLTGPWEGTDVVFHGRRPSAHDLENEIAGSPKVDEPVLMKEDSPTTDRSESVGSSDVKSYQVVIVGGVPQKSVSPAREIKQTAVQSPLLRRKSSVTLKFATRRISCKDLGNGDCQGWLYKQKEQKRFLSGARWTKRWVILKQHHLYSYHDKDDPRAECLIFLPGFTVSPAPECKSKKYSFKLHHPGTTFYFATDSQDDMTKWMNKMGLAAIAYDATLDETTSGFVKIEKIEHAYYSETEDESEDNSPAGSRCSYTRESSPSSLSSSNIRHKYYEYLQGDYHLEDTHNSVLSLNNQSSVEQRQHLRYFQGKQMRSASRKQGGQISSSSPRHESFQSQDSRCVPTFRMGYVRSLSCTDAPSHYMHHTSHDKHGTRFSAGSQFPRKMSYQEQSSGTSFVGTEEKCGNPKLHRLSGQWASTEDKMQDYPTGSLGRQRMLAKEITPGIVARMTGSYNNLSQKNVQNTSVEKRKSKEPSTPTAGYVAKLSGSFDQLAKGGWKASNKMQSGNHREQSEVGNYDNFQPGCTGNNSIKKLHSESVSEKNNTSEKFVSMLDKEYHRLYGKKKPSTISIQFNGRDKQYKNVSSGASSESLGFSKSNQLNKNIPSSYNAESYYGQRTTSHQQKYDLPPNTKYDKQLSAGSTFKDDLSRVIASVISDNVDCLQHCNSSQPVVAKQAHVKIISTHDQKDQCLQGVQSTQKNFEFVARETNPSSTREAATDYLEHRRLFKETPLECDDSHSSFKSGFKFFGSPKFMKKFASPKQEKKPVFKSKFGQSQDKIAPALQERTFLGSPKLARAIFGSPKCERRTVTTTSAAVQTDKNINLPRDEHSIKSSMHNYKSDVQNISSQCHQETVDECLKTSSNSSLNSSASGSAISSTGSSHYYVETRIRPQITISLPLVTESNSDDRPTTPETPRTPKPTMGVAMIGKRRTPSISNEGSKTTSTKGAEHFTFERNEVMVNINDDKGSSNDLSQLMHVIRQSGLTLDGVDIRSRRCRTLLRDEKAISQLMKSFGALQRTLKDKEMELAALNALLEGTITSKKLELWTAEFPHYMPPEYC